jgi:hypothetical protein
MILWLTNWVFTECSDDAESGDVRQQRLPRHGPRLLAMLAVLATIVAALGIVSAVLLIALACTAQRDRTWPVAAVWVPAAFSPLLVGVPLLVLVTAAELAARTGPCMAWRVRNTMQPYSPRADGSTLLTATFEGDEDENDGGGGDGL